jgi:hypothetical protein
MLSAFATTGSDPIIVDHGSASVTPTAHGVTIASPAIVDTTLNAGTATGITVSLDPTTDPVASPGSATDTVSATTRFLSGRDLDCWARVLVSIRLALLGDLTTDVNTCPRVLMNAMRDECARDILGMPANTQFDGVESREKMASDIRSRTPSMNRTGGILEFHNQGKKHNFCVRSVISYGLAPSNPMKDLVLEHGAPLATCDFVVYPILSPNHWDLLTISRCGGPHTPLFTNSIADTAEAERELLEVFKRGQRTRAHMDILRNARSEANCWKCPTCTLLVRMENATCEACKTPRPALPPSHTGPGPSHVPSSPPSPANQWDGWTVSHPLSGLRSTASTGLSGGSCRSSSTANAREPKPATAEDAAALLSALRASITDMPTDPRRRIATVQSQVPCRFFARGQHCSFDPVCQFSHDPAVRDAALAKWAKQRCIQYARNGRCDRGDDCRYIHSEAPLEVCRDHQRGRCNRGGDCSFRHGEAGPASVPKRVRFADPLHSSRPMQPMPPRSPTEARSGSLTCFACSCSLLKSDFSKNQLSKGVNRSCKSCVTKLQSATSSSSTTSNNNGSSATDPLLAALAAFAARAPSRAPSGNGETGHPSARSGGSLETLECSKCSSKLRSIDFSRSQMSKGIGRRCRSCVSSTPLAAPEQVSSNLIGGNCSSPAGPVSTGGNVLETLQCSKCSRLLPRTDFSRAQITRGADRCCGLCTSATLLAAAQGSALACSMCRQSLPKSAFSHNQAAKGADRRCRSCVEDALACSKCARSLPRSEFSRNQRNMDVGRRCRSCIAASATQPVETAGILPSTAPMFPSIGPGAPM